MYYLLLHPGIKGLEGVLEIFMEQLDDIRSIPPAVFFEKAVLKIFRKSLEYHLQHLHISKTHDYAEYEHCR